MRQALRATRAVVISDLHLGGDPPQMMSQPHKLASFISRLADGAFHEDDEHLELVIAGDFVDFLAVPPYAAWTANQDAARDKLRSVMDEQTCRCVFDQLGRFVANGHRLTILAGNHDPEMILPAVQDAFFARVQSGPHEVHFVNDGRAYRIGRALIEHGDRYDESNWVDWDGLRAIASSSSRWESAPAALVVSAGSTIVEKVVNPIKFNAANPRRGYPFIDLLQPQGEVLAFLLLSFEPALKWQWDALSKVLRGRRRQANNPDGLQPSQTRHVSAGAVQPRDDDLARLFPDEYAQLDSARQAVAAWDMPWFTPQKDGLAAILERGERVPGDRLDRIGMVLRKLLVDDDSKHWNADAQQYGKAARRYVQDSNGQVETVLMGHTHLPRHLGPPEHAWYINTGSWADVIRIPNEVLQVGESAALEAFLLDLWKDQVRVFMPTHASLRIEETGHVREARLLNTEP